MPRLWVRALPFAALLLTGLLHPHAAAAQVGPAETLRVGTSGDYPPFSSTAAGAPAGFDIDVATAYAKNRGLALEFVPFAWPELIAALDADRFDVAMSGITVREDRSLVGRFSVPLLETGAVILAAGHSGADSFDDLDQHGTRIGVNAGGHLERVANRAFRLATIVAIPSNAGVLAALGADSVDAVVTDSVEAPLWESKVEDTTRIGPITRDRKAYLVSASRAKLAGDLDAWLLEREADGSLTKWRREHFVAGNQLGPDVAAGALTATPLAALVAAMDERLALMPSVAAVKRAKVLPIAAPARERKVLAATLAAVREAAAAAGRPAPAADAVNAFTQAQMDAAKAVQMAAVRDEEFAPPDALPDLDTELRPALLRIGERIAALIIALPEDLPTHEIASVCSAGLRAAWLAPSVETETCAALAVLARAPRVPPEGSAQEGPGDEAGGHR